MKKLSSILLALSLTACGGGEDGPKGAVTVASATISNVDASCVRSTFIQRAGANGSTIRANTPEVLVVGKATTNPMASMLFYTRLTGLPEERVQVTFAVNGRSTTIYMKGFIVSRAGSGLERAYDMKISQVELDAIASQVALTCGGATL